jgi:hypothetical protein
MSRTRIVNRYPVAGLRLACLLLCCAGSAVGLVAVAQERVEEERVEEERVEEELPRLEDLLVEGDFEDDSEEARALRQAMQREIMEISCRDEDGRPESWLDRAHSYMNQRLCEPAAWFDGFFGDPRSFEETPVGNFLRVRNTVRWDETEDFDHRFRVQASLALPRVSDRIRLLITRDEDLTGSELDNVGGADDDTDRTRIGLRFLATERARSRFDIDATVRASGATPNPRVRGRYRYAQALSDRSLARLTQSVFWEVDEGFGTTSRVDYEILPDRDSLYRWTGQGTISEESDGVDWRSSLVAFSQLSARDAMRYEAGVIGYTKPKFEVEEYFVAVRYRRQFLRPWLFFELQPEYAWPLDQDTGKRRSDLRFSVALEVQFENETSRSRRIERYTGEEGAAETWSDDLPIPVDAPGAMREGGLLQGNGESGARDDAGDGEGG